MQSLKQRTLIRLLYEQSFKESDEGVSSMSKIWDELLEKSKELGIYEGERQGRIEINAVPSNKP